MNSISRYVASGHSSCGTRHSSSSATVRTAVIEGITLSRKCLACFSTDPFSKLVRQVRLRAMKRRRLLIALLLIAAGITVLAWMLSSKVERTTLKLTNGERLTFCAIGVGTNTTYCYGNILQRMAAHIPGSLGDRLSGGTRAESWHYSDSNIVLWFLCEGGVGVFHRIQFRVVDEQGIESDPYFDRNSAYSDGDTVGYFVHAGILPRRSPRIRLRISEADKWGEPLPVGELHIPNPLYGKYPEWTAEPLPATRQFGEVAVTLDELNVSLDSSWMDMENRPIRANVARFRLRITESNQLTDEWAFFGARCSDATGDFSNAWNTTWRRLGPGHLEMTGSWPLWPGEKTVKLQTLWVRKEIQPSDRILTFYGLPLPPIGPTATIIASTNHPLGEISVTCRPASWPHNGEWILELFSSSPRFYRYDDSEVECYFFQAARDEKGKELERIDGRRFRVPTGTKSVDLAIHLPKAKRADFMVSPRLISTNAPVRQP